MREILNTAMLYAACSLCAGAIVFIAVMGKNPLAAWIGMNLGFAGLLTHKFIAWRRDNDQ